jgi:hypothetical protein
LSADNTKTIADPQSVVQRNRKIVAARALRAMIRSAVEGISCTTQSDG